MVMQETGFTHNRQCLRSAMFEVGIANADTQQDTILCYFSGCSI